MDPAPSPITFNLTNPEGVPTIGNTPLFTSPATPFQYQPNLNNPPSNFSSGKFYSQKYNELFYKVELYLDNSGKFTGGTNDKRYFINPAAVMNLTMTDTVNDWIVDGSILIMYLPEDIDQKQFKTMGQDRATITGAQENAETLNSYQFRSDGFDLLRVMMVPKTDLKSDLKIDEKDPAWYLSHLFSIYDVEDVTSNVPGLEGSMSTYMKCVKLSFRDVRYQILKTTNLEYSTALSPNADFNSGLANQGALYTGEAILEVFNKALADPKLDTGCQEFAVTSGPNWDIGAGKLFYTSPAGWSADEDIQYLFSHHVSKKSLSTGSNDLCLLHTNRAKTPQDLEPICITPLTDFFAKAGKDKDNPGELQLEHFFTTTQTTEDEMKGGRTKLFRAPMGGSSSKVDLKTAKYGQILSYSFVDMSADVNSSAFVTTPVYSVDIGKRKFNVEFKNNDVKSARSAIANTYIKELYTEGSAKEDLFLSTIHKTKKSINVFPTFSLNGDNKIARQRNGILDLIYTGLFHNACICFKTFGLTLRQSGTFIGIDKVEGCDDNEYNNKLYGQWFVVKVDHIFEAGTYMNMIYAVKVHRFKANGNGFGETI
jgi:hypothetical protein